MTTRPLHRMLLLALLLPCAPASGQWLESLPDAGECTIGVASGRGTTDGRPLLWKTRDATEEQNEVRFLNAGGWSYLAVVNADAEVPWMAVNERGLALVNANSLDLPGVDNSGNGRFMQIIMSTCATVADVRRLLDSTNETGRLTQAHFALIDTTGAAALFETGGSQYWTYDAGDSAGGRGTYIVRTNFALNGGGTTGRTRYLRSCALIADLAAKDSLSRDGLMRVHMRDMADPYGRPFSIPYPYRYQPHLPVGYIPSSLNIVRAGSVSAAVIEGVRPGEPAFLTTLWAMLGQPAVSFLLPYWPVGATPAPADGPGGAPLCAEAQRLETEVFQYVPAPSGGNKVEYIDSWKLDDGRGGGIWGRLLPGEALIMREAGELLTTRRRSPPDPGVMLEAEALFAGRALEMLRVIEPGPTGGGSTPAATALEQNYPNPFNGSTRIPFILRTGARVRIVLHDILGRELLTLTDGVFPAGSHELPVSLADLPSGFYVYRLLSPGTPPLFRKLLIVR